MIPLQRIVLFFACLLAGGILLTIPLFKFNFKKFIHSQLFIKILFWIPIFIIFLGTLYLNNPLRLLVLAIILEICFIEFAKNTLDRKNRSVIIIFFAAFGLGLLHFVPLQIAYAPQFINLLITLAFATVLADVTAFFMGNYFGRHKFPAWLNQNKSWEGAIGQVIGALLGVLLVNQFIVPVVSVWIFLPIGLGSVAGDLANSYIKRRLNIKDWSRAIPGHGGFIDRFSSFAGSVVLTFYFLLIPNP